MEEIDLGTKVLDKIKNENIEPKARWKFLLKDYVLWIAGIIALNIGGLAISVIIYLIFNSDYDVYKHLEDNFISFFLLTLPYFWIIVFVGFVFLMKYNFKHTKNGYKVELYKIILLILTVSFLAGIIFYYLGIADILENTLQEKVPVYREFLNPRFKKWMQPEMGFLFGTIVDFSENSMLIKDMEGNEWKIVFPKSNNIIEQINQLPVEIRNNKIRIIGEKINDNTFSADQIFPLLPGKMKKQLPQKLLNCNPERKMKNMRITI